MLSAAAAALSTAVFYRLTYDLPTDIGYHDRYFSQDFLYHLLVWTLSGFGASVGALSVAGIVVLTAAVMARALVAYAYLLPAAGGGAAAEGARPRRAWVVAAATGGLVLAMPLPNWWKFPALYLGQITPNVWHNPTLIVAMPSVPCHYSATCSGTYEKCGGIIRKLSPERLAQEEREAWKDEKGPWAPTDSSHDDYGDIVGSITTYECPKCGKTFNARQGIAGRYDYGTPKCVVVRCNRCGRVPAFDELPVCDSAR